MVQSSEGMSSKVQHVYEINTKHCANEATFEHFTKSLKVRGTLLDSISERMITLGFIFV